MIEIGTTDAFERIYTQKFRLLASKFGEFVMYERDRGARDIGLHLSCPQEDGKERLSASLCWFQLKGIMKDTLPRNKYDKLKVVPISIKVSHLRYWYLQLMPTYLALFIESCDLFLVVDIQKYVEDKWGRSILQLDQKYTTITLPCDSPLDAQAFMLILRQNEREQWIKVLNDNKDNIRFCQRDHSLIWHIGTADARSVSHRIQFRDWQTKTRGELYIEEVPAGHKGRTKLLRSHIQYMLSVDEIEGTYPYLYFSSLDPDELDDDLSEDEDEYQPWFELSTGQRVYGANAGDEYHEFCFEIRLNSLGYELFKSVEQLEQLGYIQVENVKPHGISIAPWNNRSV